MLVSETHCIPDSSWDDAIVVKFSDASFCRELEQHDGVTKTLNHNKLVSQHWHVVTR